MNSKRFLSIIFITIISFSSIQSAHCPEFITIYVHGTTTKLGLRLLSKFYKEMTFGKFGIHHFNDLPQNSLLREDAKILQNGDPKRFDAAHFYTFGWSGSLSFKARQIAGHQLYDGVKELLQEYQQKYGKIPKLRIWTFSHGGNVALNMVNLLPFFENQPVHLELVLVAVPVQKVTEKLIEHDGIAQSYVISSTRDLMQVLDRYKFEKKRYTPERFFATTKQNCRQVKVFINNRGLGHVDLLRSFTIHLPDVLNFADNVCTTRPCLLSELCESIAKTASNPDVVLYSICDPQFRFYNVFNLAKVVRGKRKVVKVLPVKQKKLKKQKKAKKSKLSDSMQIDFKN